MTTIAVCSGLWGTNIGNAFFQLGVRHALEKVMPDAKFISVGDPHWKVKYGIKTGAWNILLDDVECDYLVMSGPVFCESFTPVWADSLRRFQAKGTKVIMLSTGTMEYSQTEYNLCRPILQECKPYAMITRDSNTYKMYSEFAEHSYDGICCAFFSNDYFSEAPTMKTEDIVLNFDKGHDFNVLEEYGPEIIQLLENGSWDPQKKSPAFKRSRQATRLTEYDRYRIVRTDHATSPPLWRKVLKQNLLGHSPSHRENCFVSDTPEGYLNLYRHGRLTISERVHACVPTIAFGNYAWLISDTKRSALFSRVGLEEITERPVRIQSDFLKQEKSNMLEFLASIFGSNYEQKRSAS